MEKIKFDNLVSKEFEHRAHPTNIIDSTNSFSDLLNKIQWIGLTQINCTEYFSGGELDYK